MGIITNINEAINEIKKGNVNPVYLITGDNSYFQDQFIKIISTVIFGEEKNDFNYHKIDKINNLSEIIETANSLPFLANKRLIVVTDHNVFKAGSFSEREIKNFTDYLREPCNSTCLIFLIRGSVDKRGKLYKTFQKEASIVECILPKGMELIRWIKSEFSRYNKKPDTDLINYFASISNTDLYFLSNEINKICCYAHNMETISLTDVKEVLSKTLDAGIFQMIDHISDKNVSKALKELNNLLELGEPPILINYMLARHYRQLLQAYTYSKKGYSEKTLATKIGVPPFVIGKMMRQIRNKSMDELVEALNIFYQMDKELKSSSIDIKRTLELNIIKLAN